MLWLIFRALAEALYMMRTGLPITRHEPLAANRGLPNAQLPQAPRWQPYVNTDIKLANVVIGPATDWYPAYKTPLMIDFGHTYLATKFETRDSKKLTQRPLVWRGIGTPGDRPPVNNTAVLMLRPANPRKEQFEPPHRKHGHEAIDTRSMIWNFGKIMFQLMDQRPINVDTDSFDFIHSPEYRRRNYRYWPELETLVKQCLKNNPNLRPQLNEILYSTRIGLENWEQNAMKVNGTDVPPEITWSFKKEDFAIGQDVPKHWRWATRKRPGHDDSSDGDEPPRRKKPRSDAESTASESDGREQYRPNENRTVKKRGGKEVKVSMKKGMPSATKGPLKKREYKWMEKEKKKAKNRDEELKVKEPKDAENEGVEESRTNGGRNRGSDFRSILGL
jgi:hypothetical protein